jgi:hypothetical protein
MCPTPTWSASLVHMPSSKIVQIQTGENCKKLCPDKNATLLYIQLMILSIPQTIHTVRTAGSVGFVHHQEFYIISYLEFGTVGKVHRPSNSGCCKQLSESFRFYIHIQWQMEGQLRNKMNWKDVQASGHELISGTIQLFLQRDQGTAHKTSDQITCFLSRVWTWDHLIMKQYKP